MYADRYIIGYISVGCVGVLVCLCLCVCLD